MRLCESHTAAALSITDKVYSFVLYEWMALPDGTMRDASAPSPGTGRVRYLLLPRHHAWYRQA